MTEKMKAFLESISKDQELIKKVSTMTDKADIIAVANSLDIDLSEADFDAPEGELSEKELVTISGGTITCICPLVGGGTSDDGLNTPCACIAGGGGVDYADLPRCACIVAGVGEDIWI